MSEPLTSDVIVARQAREIYELRDRLSTATASLSAIHDILYCIGGPLNDNILGFNQAQLKTLQQIARETE